MTTTPTRDSVAERIPRGIAGVIQTLDVPMETTYGWWEPDGVARPWVRHDGSDSRRPVEVRG